MSIWTMPRTATALVAASPAILDPWTYALDAPVSSDAGATLELSEEDQELLMRLRRATSLFGARRTAQGILFVYPPVAAHSFAVAGSFNNWQPRANLLTFDRHLLVWQSLLKVAPGPHHYRLIIDGHWTHDWFNPRAVPNSFGAEDSLLEA